MRISMAESFGRIPAPVGSSRPRRVGNNTFSYRTPDGSEVIRLHTTDVVVKRPDGRVRLDTGGWRTVTTKARINDQIGRLGYSLYSDRGVWKVRNGHDAGVPYFDGIVLPDDLDRPDNGADKRARELKRKIKAFVDKIDDLDALPFPDDGDCWYCLMFDSEPSRQTGRHGFRTDHGVPSPAERDNEHLIEHIEEGYLHGSLIVNAMRWCGYADRTIAYHLDPHLGHRPSVKRALRRYLQHRLGIGF